MNIIRQIRLQADLTQQELARRAGTSQSTIAAYETGSKSPTLRTLDRVFAGAQRSTEVDISAHGDPDGGKADLTDGSIGELSAFQEHLATTPTG